MAEPSHPAPTADPTDSLDQWRPARLLSLVLLVPAVALLTIGYVIPTVSTVRDSFRSGVPTAAEREWIGLDHYRLLWEQDYAAAFQFAGSVTLWPITTVTVLAWVIAYLVNRAGWAARWVVRLALALPMVALAPTAFAVGWRLDRSGALAETTQHAPALIRSAVAFTMFGLLVGVGVTIYLATMRHREHTRPAAATLVAAVLATIATFAVGLQLYSYPTVLAPAWVDATPLVLMFQVGFLQGDIGVAAAAATALLAVLAVLGVLAVTLTIATGLRIEVPPTPRQQVRQGRSGRRPRPVGAGSFQGTKAAARHPEAVFGSFLALVAVLAVTGYGLWPWLSRLLQFRGAAQPGPLVADAGQVLANTWLPPLVGAVIGMAAAVTAGFAIGALRPLGRFSPALLLLFAPWLFVGNGVLSLAEYRRLIDLDLVDSPLSLIPPGWVVVPAVVVFALLFRGQEPRWRELRAAGGSRGGATTRAFVLPALPMFWLIGGITWLAQAQSLLWNSVSARAGDQSSGPVAVLRALTGDGNAETDPVGVGLVLPFVVVIGFAVGLAVLQLTYLDRLAIRVGRR